MTRRSAIKAGIIATSIVAGTFLRALHQWLALDEPLWFASSEGDLNEMKYLLVQGANPNARLENTTALVTAANNDFPRAVTLLLNFGADPLLTSGGTPLISFSHSPQMSALIKSAVQRRRDSAYRSK